MITILTNNSCIREKKYVFDIIFSEFLGVDHSIEIDEGLTEELVIIPAPSTQLTLLDIFFTKAEKKWLSEETLPGLPLPILNIGEDTMECNVPYTSIPVLFGTPFCRWNGECAINCGIDIFGSIFFMLSRYEEAVIKDRERQNRFSALSSVCYSSGLLLRPVVNEYLELLWQMLLMLAPGLTRKKRAPQTTLTSDVDWPFNPDNQSLIRMIKSMISRIVKHGQVRKAAEIF